MKTDTAEFLVDLEFQHAIRMAGKELVEFQTNRTELDVYEKSDGSAATNADVASQRILIRFLHTRYPNLPILAEEERLSHARDGLNNEFPNLELLSASDETTDLPDRYASIDPADGTVFLQSGSKEFAISVGIVDAGNPVAGAVFQPSHDSLFAWPVVNEAALTQIPQIEAPLVKRMIGLDNCRSAGEEFQEQVISPLVNGCRYPENLGSVTSGIHVVQGITGAWVTNNARNWDVAATALLVTKAGGVVHSLVQDDRSWRTDAIPWNMVRMPPLLFAANERVATDVLDVLNHAMRFRRRPR